ncbi:MAG: hypothetical protein LBF40_09225 [Deltaproteobacteria bacterium]|nr:hypothetical protein [Deltaproteobacteria bacterium]
MTLAFSALEYLHYMRDMGLGALVPKPGPRKTPIAPKPRPSQDLGQEPGMEAIPPPAPLPSVPPAHALAGPDPGGETAGSEPLAGPPAQAPTARRRSLSFDPKRVMVQPQAADGPKSPKAPVGPDKKDGPPAGAFAKKEGDALKPSAGSAPQGGEDVHYYGPPPAAAPARRAPQGPANVNPGTGEPLPALWIKKSESLAELREGVEGCMLCPLGVKGGARFQGRGDVGARLLLAVGVPEAAAVKDGDFLTKEENALLEAIISKGLKLGPTDVYVMPVVKCPRQVEDFLPLATTKVCANISLKEIRLVAPKAVVSFGLDAARLLSKEGGVLDALRRKKGRTLESGNSFVPFRMTMGLDSMLEFPELKKDAWQDLQEILRLIG